MRVLAVQVGLRPKDERIGADRLQHDLGHLHRGFAGLVVLFVGEQDASFGKGLAEDVAEFVRDEHRADVVQLELLGDGFGGKRLVQPDHDRRDLVAGEHDLDPVERLDGVTPDHHALVLGDLAGASPGFLQLGDGGHSGRDAAETGRLDRRRLGRSRVGDRLQRRLGLGEAGPGRGVGRGGRPVASATCSWRPSAAGPRARRSSSGARGNNLQAGWGVPGTPGDASPSDDSLGSTRGADASDAESERTAGATAEESTGCWAKDAGLDNVDKIATAATIAPDKQRCRRRAVHDHSFIVKCMLVPPEPDRSHRRKYRRACRAVQPAAALRDRREIAYPIRGVPFSTRKHAWPGWNSRRRSLAAPGSASPYGIHLFLARFSGEKRSRSPPYRGFLCRI